MKADSWRPKWYQTIPVCNDKRNECVWCLNHGDWYNSPSNKTLTTCPCDPTKTEAEDQRVESRCRHPRDHKQGRPFIVLFRGGRGIGKSARGRETVIEHLRELGSSARVGVGAQSNVEARKLAEGDQGIITHYGKEFTKYNRSPGLCEAWHEKGGYVYFAGMTADDAKAWNGENLSLLWPDEIGLCSEQVVKQAILCVRKGRAPWIQMTGTPKAAKWLRDLEKQHAENMAVRVASTEHNDTLPAVSRMMFYSLYAGTSLERSELRGEHVGKVEGALWDLDDINARRRNVGLDFITVGFVAVDPAVTDTEESDETGISAGGIGQDNHLYVFHMDGVRMHVDGWANESLIVLDQFQFDRIVGERNNGGDLVESVIRAAARVKIPPRPFTYEGVWASRGKFTRAEPAANLMKQGLVHHVGVHERGETELTEWVPGQDKSPNILDSYVWLCKAAEPYLMRQFGAPVPAAPNDSLNNFIDLLNRHQRGY